MQSPAPWSSYYAQQTNPGWWSESGMDPTMPSPCLANIASRLNALEADTANLRADNANLWADNANLREDNANLRTTLQGHAYEIYLLRYNAELDSHSSSLWYLTDTVSNIFLFVQGCQPANRGPHRYFQNLLSSNNPNKKHYTRLLDELGRLSSPHDHALTQPDAFSQQADAIIDERNAVVHFDNAEQLKKSVTVAMQLFARHPTLHGEYPFHYFVLQHFAVFEKVYPNIFKTSH